MERVKLVGVKMPVKLVHILEQIAEEQYKTVSTLIREMVVDYIEDELSVESWKMIEKGRKEYRNGKYTPWREAFRD